MKTRSFAVFILFQFILLCTVLSQEKVEVKFNFPVFKGTYLGQNPPGLVPELFGEKFFSNLNPLGISMMKDGNEIYFAQWGGEPMSRIMYSKIENGHWLEPRNIEITGKFRDWDQNLSPDGKRIYFCSYRPVNDGGKPKEDSDIWVTEKIDNQWSEPKNLGMPVNSNGEEVHPSIAENGNLYFFGRDNTILDIYFAKYENGHYLEPVKLGNEINSEFLELDPFIAPDESWLIFQSNRNGGFGKMDLYISFKDKANNKWTDAINMGKVINSESAEYTGRLSLDKKYFFFMRDRSIYWVNAKIIDDLKPEYLKQ
jgi:Tol biopolymer transport system component